MRRVTSQLFFVAGLAIPIASCEAPLDPEHDHSAVTSRLAPGTSSLTANAVSASQVELAWPDNSANEAGFEVHRSEAGAAFALIASTNANVTGYSDLRLTPGTQYCYKVRPFKISGRKRTYSSFSNVACATTRTPPAAASDVSTVPQNSNVIDIGWTDNSTTENGFRIEQASSPGGPWTTISTTSSNVTSTQAYIYVEQEVCYHVIAFSAADGEAPPSNVDCTTAPLSPSDLVATSPDVQTIDLTWTDNSLVEDGYELQRWDEGLGQWSIIGNLAANASTYHDPGLTPDVYYWYLVRAKKDGGYSYFSNYAIGITATSAPAAPSEVKATYYSSYSYYYYPTVVLSWTDNSTNEQAFRVQRGPSPDGPWETVATAGVNEQYFEDYLDQDLSPGQLICYRVTAYNGRGESSSSDCTAPPVAPTNLVATKVDHQSIDLSWDLTSSLVDGFVVFRYLYPTGEFMGTVAVDATERTYRDTGLLSSTSYWYWITTVYDDSYSEFSNDAFATTDPDPTTAQSLTALPGVGSGTQGSTTPPSLDRTRSRPKLQRGADLLDQRVPACPSSDPPRHECPGSMGSERKEQ
jgi:titin